MNFLRFLGVKKPCPVCGEDFYPGHSHEEKPKLSRRGFLFMAAAAPVVIPQLPSIVAKAPSIVENLVTVSTPEQLGLSIRFIKHYDGNQRPINRFDVLYGFGNLYPNNTVRVLSPEDFSVLPEALSHEPEWLDWNEELLVKP